MLALKYRRNVKIAFVTAALTLMLLVEPILAKKGHNKSSKSSRGSQRSQQLESKSSSRAHRSASAGRTSTRGASSSRTAKFKPRTRSSSPRSISQANSRRTVKSSIRQPDRIVSRHQPSRITPSRPVSQRPKATSKSLRSSFDSRKAPKRRNYVNSRKSSLFTRPANEKSQHIRTEKSLHRLPDGRKSAKKRSHITSRKLSLFTRPANEKSQHIRTDVRKKPLYDRTYQRKRYHRERTHRYDHVYRDRHGRISHRIIWPRYCFPVYYNFGGHFSFRYVYPYHHRKYIFVSLYGYWPIGYRYIRYYWYGYHPYSWYGYYPIAREVQGDTYNYYTYNYYNDNTAALAAGGADVRENLAQQSTEEPAEETLADSYFEDAVKAFEAGDYDTAVDLFAMAIELAPDDMVLPFAYSQALFANEKYLEAAEVLRTALAKVTPEKEGIFYPRGLYTDEDILMKQIDRLGEKARLYSFDGDLQLLLGYQLLGVGESDKAVEPLEYAREDLKNSASATVLLELLEKIKTAQR